MKSILGGSWAKKTGGGASLIISGVVFLTLNERRMVAQDKLRIISESKAVHLVETDTKSIDHMLDGRLIHYVGTLQADEGAGDFYLNVESTAAIQIIQLRRTVEMYQWQERKHTKKTKDQETGEKETLTTYSYEKGWSSHSESVEHNVEKRNPAFPRELEGEQIFGAKNITIGKEDCLHLNQGQISQLSDWKPLNLKLNLVTKDLPYGLYLNTGGKMLANSDNYFGNKIGDIRVYYDAILSGPYTALGKLDIENVENGEINRLIPYKAKLKESLASQGEIRVPKDLNEILGIELDSLVIPAAIIDQMEEVLLAIAPLEMNYLGPGHQSIRGTFQNLATRDFQTSLTLRGAGGSMIFLGILSALPMMAATSVGGIGTAAAAAAYLSWKTIETAKPKKISSGRFSEVDEEI